MDMYIREIPEEHRKEIIEIVNRNKGSVIRFSHLDLIKLFTYYYRYIGNLRPGKDVRQTAMIEMQCGKCVGRVQKYFINEVAKWQ
jgi:hypothetical protein